MDLRGNEKRSVDQQCADGEFRCGNGQCISEDKKCNRHYDCTDGTDETACDYFIAVRKHHESQKTTHEAQPQEVQHTQQENQEEEQKHRQHHESHHQSSHHAPTQDPNQECNDQQFRCPYLVETKCFHYDKLCDGVDDCGDGSDESNCESASQEDGEAAEEKTAAPQQEERREHHAEQTNGHCSHEQFRCGNGKCIEKSLECNHKYDCDDGTDETECEYFKQAMARRNNEGEKEQEDERRRLHEESQRKTQQEEREREEQRRTQEAALRQQHEERAREEERRRVDEQSERTREAQLRRGDADRETELRRREEEVKRREEEEARREAELRRREEEESRREAHERALEEERRREAERQEDEHHKLPSPGISQEVIFREEYDDDVACLDHEFQCHTGECIDKRRVCDTRPDCLDSSDEANCFEKQRPAVPEPRREELPQPAAVHHERHPAQPVAHTQAPPQLPQPTRRFSDLDS